MNKSCLNQTAMEIALRTAIIATQFGYKRLKLGNEGIMLHYDLCMQVAEESLKPFPMSFDWEKHYEHDGDDFDVEIEKFAESYTKENLHIDENYFKD